MVHYNLKLILISFRRSLFKQPVRFTTVSKVHYFLNEEVQNFLSKTKSKDPKF